MIRPSFCLLNSDDSQHKKISKVPIFGKVMGESCMLTFLEQEKYVSASVASKYITVVSLSIVHLVACLILMILSTKRSQKFKILAKLWGGAV